MIIDMHVHVFPDSLAPRVKENLERTSGLEACTDLTEAGTRRLLRRSGVDLAVVMPIATKPGQQRTINDWAASLQHDSLVSFGTVHPFADDALTELQRVKTLGLLGIKLHPDYQLFEVDDRAVYPLYEAAAALELPVLFHAGFDPVSPEHSRCRPAALGRVLRDLPDLTVIGAHLGGHLMEDEVLEHLAGRDLFLDVSLAQLAAQPDKALEIVRRHDPERILFASDCPWGHPAQSADWTGSLPIPSEDKDRIFSKNAASLLRLQTLKSGT